MPRGNGKFDNVGAASVVAINTDTGEVPWRYTVVPGDPWDYDTPQTTPLIIAIDGRKTIVQLNKTGFIHYLDAAAGQFLRAARFSDRINWPDGYDVESARSTRSRCRNRAATRWRRGLAFSAG